MLMGIPVIGADSSAVSELISDGLNGLLFKSGNCSDLAEKIQLCKDDNLIETLNQTLCSEKEKIVFSLDAYFEQLFHIYRKL